MMTDLPPTKFRIMADWGAAYAWDEDGACTVIADYFPDHPELWKLQAVEEQLEWWASGIYDFENPYGLTAHQTDKVGLRFARELAGLLVDYGIPVTFVPNEEIGKEGKNASDVEFEVFPASGE